MPKPCTICSRLDRASIDLRLARHQVNVHALARELGCADTTLRRHRDQHVESFLKVYGASPELPSKGQLHGELMRLYVTTLDALSLAEAGTLEGLNDDGTERRSVSHTAIQGYIREARRLAGEIAALAADAGEGDERPTGMARGELAQRIMARLDSHSYAPHALPAQDVDAVEVDSDALARMVMQSPSATGEGTPGGQAGRGAAPSPHEKALDAVMAPETLPGIQAHPRLKQVIKDHEATLERRNDPGSEDSPAVMYAPNPNYPGSPAASAEERAAAGWPDVQITLEDIKSLPEEVARLIAEHRAASPTQQDEPQPR